MHRVLSKGHMASRDEVVRTGSRYFPQAWHDLFGKMA